MASATTNSNIVSKYDSMSQEELITQCKRQLMLLKNLKSKCDHLQNNLKEKNENDEKNKLQAHTVHKMQVEFDKLNDQLDIKNEEKNQIQKMLDEITQQLTVKIEQNVELSKSNRDLKNSFEKSVKKNEDIVLQLETEVQALFKEKKILKQRIKTFENESKNLNGELAENYEKLQKTQLKLKEIEKNTEVLKKTTLRLNDSDEQIQKLNKTIAEYEERIDNLQQQFKADTDERKTKYMQSLETAQTDIKCLKNIESGLRKKIDELNNQTGTMQNSIDNYQINVEERNHKVRFLENALENSIKENKTNKIFMQQTISGLKTSLDKAVIEKNSITSEYESYKIRVYSVLKQQKIKEKNNEEIEESKTELLKEQKQSEELKTYLLQAQKTILSRDNELSLLQKNYNILLKQQQLASDMAVDKDNKWMTKLKSLQHEITNTRKDNIEQANKLKRKNQDLQVANEKVVEELNKLKNEFQKYKINLIEKQNEEINDLKKQFQKKMEISPIERNTPKTLMAYNNYKYDITMIKREEGEGAEEEASSLSIGDDGESFKSLESLIEGPQILSVKMMSKKDIPTSELQCKSFEKKAMEQERKIKHLSTVCRENEQTSARLQDQNRLLKEEIRRLERNESRKESVSNLEYLKNIIVKFIKLPPSDEKSHLVPVIDTMLQLTSDEKSALQIIAQGESNERAQQSWGGYFQRWSV